MTPTIAQPATVRVIHTVNSIDPSQGGPSRTVPALCRSLSADRPAWQVELVTSRDELRHHIAVGGADLLHDHGQWLPLNHASAVQSRRSRTPRIVSPRGMLSPWSRRHRRWKKSLAWTLYARRDLASAAVIHATSELEKQELRALGVKQPIAMIPNGVEPRPAAERSPEAGRRPYVLFMSRIHEKKGVRELLETWHAISDNSWDLVLAGPDEQGLMGQLRLPSNARYVGMVEGRDKARLLADASLFILPSYSENFGLVVAEALMAEVPVIATHGTPWRLLQEESCGWWIEMNPSTLRRALQSAMATPLDELRAMGVRGRRVVESRFGWSEIARNMAAVYDWTLGGGCVPECVALK